MTRTRTILAGLVGLTLGFIFAISPGAIATAPSGDYTKHEWPQWFTGNVQIDGTLTAAGLDCSATRSWTGGAISLNPSSNFAVNVATGTSTGTVTIGSGTTTQAIAVAAGTGDLTMTSTDDFIWTATDDVTLNGGSAGSVLNFGTNTHGNVIHIGDNDTTADTITIGSAKDTSSLAGISVTVGSTGTTSALVLQSGTGDVLITSTDDLNIGTNAVAQDIVIGNSTVGTDVTLTGGAGSAIVDLNGWRVTPPAAQTIAEGGTIAADACGGLKRITSAAPVTTAVDNTLTAPAASNLGCCMDIVNLNAADSITLDVNANTILAGGANVVLGSGDTVRVCSNGSAWYQIGATGNN